MAVALQKMCLTRWMFIGTYGSQGVNETNLMIQLESFITTGKTTVIGVDFNICAFAHPRNFIIASLRELGFNQLVETSPHIEGGMIIHVHIIQGENSKFSYKVDMFPKYYSDYDGVGIILCEVEKN